MTISRRGILGGFLGLLAAPAIVRASSLMPIEPWAPLEGGYGPLVYTIRGIDTFGNEVVEKIALPSIDHEYQILATTRRRFSAVTGIEAPDAKIDVRHDAYGDAEYPLLGQFGRWE